MRSTKLDSVTLKVNKVDKISEQEQSELLKIFKEFKVVILDCDPSPNPKENLLALTKFFGAIKLHKRSDRDGVVPVAYLPDSPGYLDTTNLTAPMHTDGSFETEPPLVVALQCEIPALNGGLSTMVHALNVYQYLTENYPLQLPALFNPNSFLIKRIDGQMATQAIFREHDNRIYMVFRSETDDSVIEIHPEVKNAFNLIKDYVNNPSNQTVFQLQANQILLVDNTSVLHGRTSFPKESVRKLNKLWFTGTEYINFGFDRRN